MNYSNLALSLSAIFVLVSCSTDSNTLVVENINEVVVDSVEEGSQDENDGVLIKFTKTDQNVTLDLCNDYYCGIKQLNFRDENIGYAVSGVNLYKTNNAGLDWNIILNADIVGKLVLLSEKQMFLNTYEGILVTNDKGESWSVIDRPLEFICSETFNINPGKIFFVDLLNGFIQDYCDKGELYSTDDLGGSWQIIYSASDDIQEYYFQDSKNGFVIVNNVIYLTEDKGMNWREVNRLPSYFDYVIEKEDIFLFPDGKADVSKPMEADNPGISVINYDVNQNGDIAIILFDALAETEKWQLMLYVNKENPEWIQVDQLSDLVNEFSTYSSIHITSQRTIYVSESDSGIIKKYKVE